MTQKKCIGRLLFEIKILLWFAALLGPLDVLAEGYCDMEYLAPPAYTYSGPMHTKKSKIRGTVIAIGNQLMANIPIKQKCIRNDDCPYQIEKKIVGYEYIVQYQSLQMQGISRDEPKIGQSKNIIEFSRYYIVGPDISFDNPQFPEARCPSSIGDVLKIPQDGSGKVIVYTEEKESVVVEVGINENLTNTSNWYELCRQNGKCSIGFPFKTQVDNIVLKAVSPKMPEVGTEKTIKIQNFYYATEE